MITVVYCTRESNPKHTEHLIKRSGLHKKLEVIEIINNGESLTTAYNRGLKQATNDIVVFCHDDISFDNSDWGNKIIKHFNDNPEYGILGLAGTTDIGVTGRWWEDKRKMLGVVNHEHGGKKWESKYSKSWNDELNEVLLVDGLFFAVHKNRIKNEFDENFKGFHFYEIDFCFSNFLKNVKIGVMYNIRVTHQSIGATNEEWEKNRLQFIEKYVDELPEKLVPDFYNKNEVIDSNVKTTIKVVVQSSGDIETFNVMYDKIMSFNYPYLKIVLITNERTYGEFKDLKYENVTIFEGFYNTLNKNLSILKFEDDFITKDDELVVFINDNVKIINNIFYNIIKIYKMNKNNFGCIFPLSYNESKTVFSSKLEIYANSENKIAINMKDNETYYNVYSGHQVNPIGNLSDCFITTYDNLKYLDWFKLDYETPLYFNEFSLNLYLKNKTTYCDSNSLVVQKAFAGETAIQTDFQKFINFIGSNEKLQLLIKKIK